MAVLTAWGLGVGCDTETAGREGGTVVPALEVFAIRPEGIFPGGRVWIDAEGLAPSAVAQYEVRFEGTAWGRPVAVEGTVRSVAARTLEVEAGALFAGAEAEDGRFEGQVVVRRAVASEVAEQTLPVSLGLWQRAAPVLTAVGDDSEVYPGDVVVVAGEGLLTPGEGLNFLRLDGRFAPDGASPIAVNGLLVPLDAALDGERGAGRFTWTADLLGVRPGHFAGEARLVAVHASGVEVSSAPHALADLALRRPLVAAVTPLEVSRGQHLTVIGRGLLAPDPLAQAATILALEGTFVPRRGEPEQYFGADALALFPERWEGNTAATLVLRPELSADGGLAGLGARVGRFEGFITPIVLSGADAVAGPPAALAFDVAPVRQIVHLRWLPGFDEALAAFGLDVEREAVVARVLAVLARDYEGVNVAFTDAAPLDFAEYAVVEVGGVDPNGGHLFGLDNTAGKDVGNLRLDDVIGGFNAETRAANYAAYGGIFVAELLTFSPSLSDSRLASLRFDELFGEVVPALGGLPAARGESERFDARGALIRRAVRVLGNLIGSTISHEVGHTLGLAAEDGRLHHEGDNPGWIMDAGTYRPFAERAEIDGEGPGVFSPGDRAYLESVLPLTP